MKYARHAGCDRGGRDRGGLRGHDHAVRAAPHRLPPPAISSRPESCARGRTGRSSATARAWLHPSPGRERAPPD